MSMAEREGSGSKQTGQDNRYFEFLAEVGMTKHFGSLDATDELVRLCGITAESRVLDVGCGVGATPVYLAKSVGCRVVGVDITPKMIEHAEHRATQAGLREKLAFRVADMHQLPFEDGEFDAAIAESVLAFSSAPVEAMREIMRVVKPGGRVGITEATWLSHDVPEHVVETMSSDAISNADIKHPEEWERLLVDAGLLEVTARAQAIDVKREARGRSTRYGCLPLIGISLRLLPGMLLRPDYRAMIKDAMGSSMKDYMTHVGWGVYVGQVAGEP
jgi:SAM-dependent methyltransferase